MAEKWTPNAPDASAEFQKAEDNAPATEQQPEQIQGIATKAELEMRKKMRDTPAFVSEYTIGGSVEQAVHQREAEKNEQRIKYLERRLAQRNLTREFNRER